MQNNLNYENDVLDFLKIGVYLNHLEKRKKKVYFSDDCSITG